MKRFLLFAFVALIATSCTQDQTDGSIGELLTLPKTLTVGFENSESRVQLLADKSVWNANDCISVFYKSFDNLKWQFLGETGDRSGDFKLTDGSAGVQTMNDTMIVYPYATTYRIDTEDLSLEAMLPATQHYLYDSYGIGENLMVANCEFTTFTLRNVCGWLKVQLTGNGQMVTKLTLRGNNDEQVAGLIHVNTKDATSILASEQSTSSNGLDISGNLLFDNSIITEVALNCGEGVELSSDPTSFYIALPPQSFDNGITIDIECSNRDNVTMSTTQKIIIERNHIQPMSPYSLYEEEEATPGTITIAEVLALGQNATINGTIEGMVISNRALNNLTSKKSMYVQDTTAGIQFFLPSDHEFDFGTKVQIDLTGCTLGNYNGAVQISDLAIDKITIISTGNSVAAKSVSMADFLANKHEGQYIALEGVQVADADLNRTWIENNKHTSINMEDAQGNKFVVFSSKYSTFGSQSVAQGSGTIKGIANINNGTMQLIFAQKSDFAGLTGERLGAETSTTTGHRWAELPERKTSSDYIYNTHYGLLGSNSNARNYTYCFSPEHRAALWVAYPLHDSHISGSGNRNNSDFDYDPEVNTSYQANLAAGSYTGIYDRGHQLPAADRKCSQQMMNQTFYTTNMTPQHSNFNQNKWATLEGKVRNMVCADTLFVVTGAWFGGEHDSSINSSTTDKSGNYCPTPTHYYKALLRTSNGNTSKTIDAVKEASQLRAIVFWMEHANTGSDTTISSSDCITVDELERITGFDFFPMIDDSIEASVESSINPSLWGIN